MLEEIIIMFRKKYTNFTLYYVDSYTDTNTFLSNIYPNKDSTTALTNCSLIKLDYYFSVIYCTLTSDEIKIYLNQIILLYLMIFYMVQEN